MTVRRVSCHSLVVLWLLVPLVIVGGCNGQIRTAAQQADECYERGRAKEKAEQHPEAIREYAKAIEIAEPTTTGVPDETLALYYERKAICHLRMGAKEAGALDYHRACSLDNRIETPICVFLPGDQASVSTGSEGHPAGMHVFADALIAYSWNGLVIESIQITRETGPAIPVYYHSPNPPWNILRVQHLGELPVVNLSLPQYVRGRELMLPKYASVPQEPVDIIGEGGEPRRVEFERGNGIAYTVCDAEMYPEWISGARERALKE